MSRVLTWLTLGIACSAGVTSAATSEAPYHLLMARLLADEGVSREAGEHYLSAIELAPDDPFIRLEYSKFLLRRQRARRAAEEAAAARQLAPDDPDVLRAVAETQMKLLAEDPDAMESAREALERLRDIAPHDVESLVTLGQIHLSESRPEDAAEVFELVLARSAGNRMVHRLLVDAYLRAGKPAEAMRTLRRALEMDPHFTRARIGLAELLGQHGDPAQALAILEAAPTESASDIDLLKHLAMNLHRVGEQARAMSVINEVLKREPGFTSGLHLKAIILTSQGHDQEAIELLERLDADNPEHLEMALLHARLLERQGRDDDAVAVLTRVENSLRESGEDTLASRARAQRVVTLVRSERWNEVIDALSPVVEEMRSAGEVDLALLYPEALARVGRYEEALSVLSGFDSGTKAERAALAKGAEILYRMGRDNDARRRIDDLIAPGDFDDLLLAVQVFQGAGRYEEAIPLLEEALGREPDSTEVMFWLAASYERTGRNREAEGVLQGLLDRSPDFAPALNYLGYMWAEKGENLDRALQLVQQAVAIEPDNGAYVDSLGWAHFQLGQFQEAKSHLERAAVLVGEDAVVFEHLGDLYVALGEFEEARLIYQKALALDADNAAEVREKLERLREDL